MTRISVLYVDDDVDLLDICRIFLEESGNFRIDTAISAREAEEKLVSGHYDAIISDYEMPVTNGIEFLKSVRQKSGDIPFIIFTGRGREEIVIEAINNGADFYLQKGGHPQAQFAELTHKILQAVRQRRAIASIRELENRQADIINFLPDATFAIDQKGTVISWNRAMEMMTGIKSSEILGKGNYAYAIPLYNERRPMLIDLVLAPEEEFEKKQYFYTVHDMGTLTAETSLKKPDGTSVHLWGKACRLFDENGNFAGAIESIRDITERKRVEDALHARETQLSATLGSTAEGILAVDNNGKVLQVSPRFAEIWKIPRSLLESNDDRALLEFVLNQLTDADAFQKKVQALYNSDDVDTDTLTFRDGRVIERYSCPMIMDSVRVGRVWSFRDITDRKRAEEELRAAYEQISASEEELRAQYDMLADSEKRIRESEEKFRDIFDTINDGIHINEIEPDGKPGKFIEVNEVACRMLQYTHEELLEHGALDFVAGYHSSPPDEIIGELSSAGHAIFETMHRRKDGTTIPVEINTHVVRIRGKRVMVAAIRDISERKQTENTLLRVNQKLNVLSNLTRQDLITQIYVLNSYLEIARMHAKGCDGVTENIECCERAIRSIKEITEFTKDYQNMGQKPARWQNVKLAFLLGLSHIPANETRCCFETENLEIFADPLLEKAFQGLIENSIEHGNRVSDIRVWHRSAPEGVTIVFEDTGVGILPEMKEQIFLPVDGTHASVRGLFFVREILDITGITIRETGDTGMGARFEIWVPNGVWRVNPKAVAENMSCV